MSDKDCSTCKYEHEQADPTDICTRCGNCLHLTRKGRSHFPMWEPKDEDDDEYTGPPIIHYI